MRALVSFPVLFTCLILSAVQPFRTDAFEMDDLHGYVDPDEHPHYPEFKRIKQDGRRFQKFAFALKTLGIPEEMAPDFSQFPTGRDMNHESIMEHLPQIDPDGGLRRYLELRVDSVSLFKDFFSNILPLSFLEYQQALAAPASSTDSSALLARLSAVATQVKSGMDRPLTGLRIVIDPGHMGTATWDEITGKYVKYGGQKVSEGQLNLWTALLTAQQLSDLGAEVRLTRTKGGSVSTEDPDHFDINPYLNQYYYNSLDDWMSDYLHLSDTDLAREIVKAPKVVSIQSPAQKMQLYISGADLEARSRIIDEFNPDITLDIHFDASKSNALQKGMNDIEAYVPGAFRQTETGSRKVRAAALKHLLEVRRWNESVNLSSFITNSMSRTLNLPLLDRPNFLSAVKVKDGVYARNLYITRRALSSLMVYLECLHYDHVNEFYKLANLNTLGQHQGISFKYPARLKQISDGIQTGLLNYFRSL